MKKLVTEGERKLLYRHFREVIKNDPLLSTFSRKDKEVFAARMTEIEKARIEETECALTFPPEGYEVELHPTKEYIRSHPLSQDEKDVQAVETTLDVYDDSPQAY